MFTAAGVTFGIAICHEAFRYPEIARSLVLAGAQVVFAPHYVTTDDGSLPGRLVRRLEPVQREGAACAARSRTRVYVAAANVAGPDQGSTTGIVGPDGALVTSLPTAPWASPAPTWISTWPTRARAAVGAGAQYAPGVATPAVSTIPDRQAFAGLYAAEGQQMDNLCGCFWASLALRAAGIDADQEAVALAAGAILPGGDPQTHVAPGATPRCDYRVELPLAADPATARHGRAPARGRDRAALGRRARGDRGGRAVVRPSTCARSSTSPRRTRS